MSLISDPVPKFEIVSCPDRQSWKHLLWKLNQPDQSGRKRYTMLIHRPEDILRLQRSIMIAEVLHINGGGGPEASLRNFIPGRILEIPDFEADNARLMDAAAARYFFYSSEHYYAAAIQEIEHAIEKLETDLLRPEFRYILQDHLGFCLQIQDDDDSRDPRAQKAWLANGAISLEISCVPSILDYFIFRFL